MAQAPVDVGVRPAARRCGRRRPRRPAPADGAQQAAAGGDRSCGRCTMSVPTSSSSDEPARHGRAGRGHQVGLLVPVALQHRPHRAVDADDVAARAALRQPIQAGGADLGQLAVRLDQLLLGGGVLPDGGEQPRLAREHPSDGGGDDRRTPPAASAGARSEQLGEAVDGQQRQAGHAVPGGHRTQPARREQPAHRHPTEFVGTTTVTGRSGSPALAALIRSRSSVAAGRRTAWCPAAGGGGCDSRRHPPAPAEAQVGCEQRGIGPTAGFPGRTPRWTPMIGPRSLAPQRRPQARRARDRRGGLADAVLGRDHRQPPATAGHRGVYSSSRVRMGESGSAAPPRCRTATGSCAPSSRRRSRRSTAASGSTRSAHPPLEGGGHGAVRRPRRRCRR